MGKLLRRTVALSIFGIALTTMAVDAKAVSLKTAKQKAEIKYIASRNLPIGAKLFSSPEKIDGTNHVSVIVQAPSNNEEIYRCTDSGCKVWNGYLRPLN